MLGLGLKLYEIVLLLDRDKAETTMITQRYQYRPYDLQKLMHTITKNGGLPLRHPFPSNCLYTKRPNQKTRRVPTLTRQDATTPTGDIKISSSASKQSESSYSPPTVAGGNSTRRLLLETLIWFKKKAGRYPYATASLPYSKRKRSKQRSYFSKEKLRELSKPQAFSKKNVKRATPRRGPITEELGIIPSPPRPRLSWKRQWFLKRPIKGASLTFAQRKKKQYAYQTYLEQPSYQLSMITRYRKYYLAREQRYHAMIQPRVPKSSRTLTRLQNGLIRPVVRKESWKDPKVTKWATYWYKWRGLKPSYRPLVLSHPVERTGVTQKSKTSSSQRKAPFRRCVVGFTVGHKWKNYIKTVSPTPTRPNLTAAPYKAVGSLLLRRSAIPSPLRRIPRWWIKPATRMLFYWRGRKGFVPYKVRLDELKKRARERRRKASQWLIGREENPYIVQFKRKIMWGKYPEFPIMTLRYWGNGELTEKLKSGLKIDVATKSLHDSFIFSIC